MSSSFFTIFIFIFSYLHPLFSSSFITTHHLHPLSSSSSIVLILHHPHSLSSSSFIILILYHPHPLSSSSFIIIIHYHPGAGCLGPVPALVAQENLVLQLLWLEYLLSASYPFLPTVLSYSFHSPQSSPLTPSSQQVYVHYSELLSVTITTSYYLVTVLTTLYYVKL